MPKRMTNKAAQCECGSGLMPTIMDQARNRWACLKCREHGMEQKAEQKERLRKALEDGIRRKVGEKMMSKIKVDII